MLDIALKERLNSLLQYITEELDISETNYKLAEQHYQAVGKWLGSEDSPLAPFQPDIYPQGSFRLGTVVKPISGDDEYDIDLVCQLGLTRQQVTQRQLKQVVGDRLKANKTYEAMLGPEGRRCWTLNYADAARFHMDILPAIPDDTHWLVSLGVPPELARHAICLTDNKRWHIDPEWPRSNPRGYAEWFKQRMIVIHDTLRAAMAKSLNVNIEEVPDFKIKTPLQRAVQILKRHRDIMFTDDPDDKPISIIITTLAARAYNNEGDLFEAIQSILQGMPNYIQRVGGRPVVSNPVNPEENFADKWQEHPQRERKFRRWMTQAQEDLSAAVLERDTGALSDKLGASLGERVVRASMDRMGLKITTPQSLDLPGKSLFGAITFFNVPHRQEPLWPVVGGRNVRIGCNFTRSGLPAESIRSDGPGLTANCQLNFEAKTDVAPPFKVYWQVVNTGIEAEMAKDLRGRIFDGGIPNNGLSHQESTRYKGKHWIECFIVKNGYCVARSGEFVVNVL
ncbi:MAG: nucleotidyltransferase [Desulfobacterales bacterium]|nr:nucleotidyltransferase [Desulfobacterales bacterium]